MNLVVKTRHERRFYDFFTTFDGEKAAQLDGHEAKMSSALSNEFVWPGYKIPDEISKMMRKGIACRNVNSSIALCLCVTAIFADRPWLSS